MSARQPEAIQARWNEALLSLPPKRQQQLIADIEIGSRARRFLNYPGPEIPPTPHPIALTPLIFPKELLPEARSLARLVAKTLSALPTRWIAAEHDLRKIFPLHPRTAQWMKRFHRPRRAPDDLFIRLDVGIQNDPNSGKRSLRLFENNSLALAGIYNHTIGAELLEQYVAPLVKNARTTPKISAGPNLIDLTTNWINRRRKTLHVRAPSGRLFILDDPNFIETGSEFWLLKNEFFTRGIPTLHGHIGDLDFQFGRPSMRGVPIDGVWRDLAYQELDLPRTHAAAAAFFHLLQYDQMLHGFGSEFVEKGLLECFTNPDFHDLFSAEAWRFLQRVVPWTRVLWDRKTTDPNGAVINLGTYIHNERERLVIKPNRDFGGRGVLLGPTATVSQWDAAIERAMRESSRWVVQQYITMDPREMIFLQDGQIVAAPCFAAFGLFYAYDALGLHARMSRSRIVNVASGGALASVFLLE